MNPQTSTSITQPAGIVTQLLHKLNSSSLEVLPLLLFVLYIIGYVCLNIHLSRYPVVETNLLSFNYIKSSLVFIVFNMPLISVSRKLVYEFKSNRVFSNFVIYAYLILVYCFAFFIYDYFVMSNEGTISEKDKLTRVHAILLLYIPFALGAVFHYTRNKYILSIMLLTLLSNIAWYAFLSSMSFSVLVYILPATLIFLVIFYTDIYNPSIYANSKSLFLPAYCFLILCVIVLFGGIVYSKVPQVLGGGKPYIATLYLTKGEQQLLRESCALSDDETMQQQVKIIYSSDKAFYMYANAGVVVVPIETVKGIQVKRKFWFHSYM